jgi:hypothetical protein
VIEGPDGASDAVESDLGVSRGQAAVGCDGFISENRDDDERLTSARWQRLQNALGSHTAHQRVCTPILPGLAGT